MALGERLKMARHTAGLSQRDLAAKVNKTAMAISKYEREEIIPSSDVLIDLADALQVGVEFFFRPTTVTLSEPTFRHRSELTAKQKKEVAARVQEQVERYLEAEALFPGLPQFRWPEGFPRAVADLDKVEGAAEDLRRTWDLGMDPIDNLIEVLEGQGIKVCQIDIEDDTGDLDAAHFMADGDIPVIALVRTMGGANVPGDRQRFTLAHELGHIMLRPPEGADGEGLANRFAGAFLVPRAMVLQELGPRRTELGIHELYLLKLKYGLSMQGWIHRAEDLGIISAPRAKRLRQVFDRRGWRVTEPGEQLRWEDPTARLKRLVLRAVAEEVITPSRAAELLGKPWSQFVQETPIQHDDVPITVLH